MCYAIRLRPNVQLEIGDCTQKLWRTGRAAASMTVNNVFFMASQISQSIRRHVAKGKANQRARPLHGHFGKPTLLWKMATEPDKAVDNTPDGVRAGSHNPQGEPPVWWRRSNPTGHPEGGTKPNVSCRLSFSPFLLAARVFAPVHGFRSGAKRGQFQTISHAKSAVFVPPVLPDNPYIDGWRQRAVHPDWRPTGDGDEEAHEAAGGHQGGDRENAIGSG